MTWLEIAEACQKATGPDREIDYAIASALGWTPSSVAFCMDFTTSLDAITTQIGEALAEWVWAASQPGHAWITLVDMPPPPKHFRISGCATPALALCAAFALAMHERTMT